MRHAGFTLVEVLVAATILVVALLGIATVLPTADLSLHQAGQISKAVALAQEMIEMVKNDPFSQLALYTGWTPGPPAPTPWTIRPPPSRGTRGTSWGGAT